MTARFIVRDPTFVLSAPRADELGSPDQPEVAFIGRSNVGKSSLLSALVQRTNLVKVSNTPGRTRLLNLFTVDVERVEGDERVRRALRFVDLPGYGYARVSKAEKAKMGAMLSHYLGDREGISCVCQLLDSRHTPTEEDRAVYEGLVGRPYEVVLVATKTDKLPSSKRKAAVKKVGQSLGAPKPPTMFSVPAKLGTSALWERIWKATSR